MTDEIPEAPAAAPSDLPASPSPGNNDLRAKVDAALAMLAHRFATPELRAKVAETLLSRVIQPEVDQLRWELRVTRAELAKADAENNATGQRAKRAEAAIARARTVWDEHRRSNPLVRPCTCLACRMYAALDGPAKEER